MIAVLTVDGEAPIAALEPAGHAFVAEVPAAIALHEVAADRAHVAELRRRGISERERHDREQLRELRGGLEVRERRERADAHALALLARPAAQAFDAGEIDELLGPRYAVTHERDEVGPARERDRPVLQQLERLAERLGSCIRKLAHADGPMFWLIALPPWRAPRAHGRASSACDARARRSRWRSRSRSRRPSG